MVPIRVHFPGAGAFHQELKRRVNEYFESEKISERDQGRMYLKSAVIIAWSVGCWVGLVFLAASWWQALLLGLGLGLGLAGVGFSIQHDANHGGYSRNGGVNRLLSWAMDAIGGSSYIWSQKHNIVHHTYTNVSGVDVDVDVQPFLRLAPDQEWRPYHRFQHLYIWVLYALLPANWHFWADFRDLVNGHVGGQPFPKPSRASLVGTIVGKLFFYGWSLVIPLLLHPTWVVLAMHAFVSLTLGLVLTTVFQLAHCLEEAEVVTLDSRDATLETAWAEHQVRTTANFATKNPFLTWYLGGLNFQIEHHLFPRICHVHYPAISPIVAECCRDFGIPYHVHETVRSAVASHMRHIAALARRPDSTLSSAGA
ncbi:MAG: acyl-CoA desaturase [Isosphaeraceae bacterium]|nr:acyl-CoA desaturase [Isosphaeraceae bacterium]